MRHILLSLFSLFILLSTAPNLVAQSAQKLSRQEYINQFSALAIEQMNEFNIPASITMAQACLESRDGNSELTKKSNNHFGIKCNKNWSGSSVRHSDDADNECFRKYGDPLESFRDHAKFLTSSQRYQSLFEYDIDDYKKWAHGLKRAGYATDPNYAPKLIKIIEDFNLSELDSYYRSDKKYVSRQTERGGSSAAKTGNFTINPNHQRNVERRNGRKAIITKLGDTYEKIAAEFEMTEWEILLYNDATKGSQPTTKEPVYLQLKRGKAPRGNDFHIAKNGETMRSIAQWYGVKLKSLYAKNRMNKGEEPIVGQKILLRKNRR